ncbi:hypothetical protein SO802_008437 [Lithocarpus litseifolius]|uniref:Neprosin PEP catalytic domain-containing protein n=1 Tax=Lithocarpus litseifolius TaxID=425828 RepID=A0AAW2DCG9_9ROSI
MKPSSIPSDLKASSSQAALFQGWNKSRQCPEATIPIRRSQEYQHPHAIHHLKQHRTQLNHSFDIDIRSDHEYATVYINGGNFYGAHASINVWKPTVSNDGEISISQIWVVAGPEDQINTMEAGWRDDEPTCKYFRWLDGKTCKCGSEVAPIVHARFNGGGLLESAADGGGLLEAEVDVSIGYV